MLFMLAVHICVLWMMLLPVMSNVYGLVVKDKVDDLSRILEFQLSHHVQSLQYKTRGIL